MSDVRGLRTLPDVIGVPNRYRGGEKVRIFDYVDREVPMFVRMFEKRLRGYRAIGYDQTEVPPGYEGSWNETVVERDDEAFRRFDDWT